MITIRSLFPSPLFRRLGSLSRLVLLAGLSGLVPTASTLPAADLTVTVLENADGSTTFRLSGLSLIEEGGGSGGIGGGVSTNFGGNVAAPPISPLLPNPVTLPLPPGLFFTVGAEPVPVSNFFVFPTTGVPTPGAPVFSWLLFGSSPTVVVPESGSIAGSGAVTIPDFPFFLLVPGRFVVEAAETAELPPVNAAEEAPGAATAKGLLPFRTVYEVIPHDRKPGLSGISERIISRRGGRATGKILVTNRGNVPLEGLAVSGSSRDFRIGLPARTSLGPGESTTCPVTFIARRGVRASVMVSLTAKTPDRSYTPETAPGAAPETSAPGEIPEETGPIVIPGTRVKSKVLVRGEVTDSRSRGRSPRFPFGL